jgi:murein L,D-transpeptidase YafK
LYLLTVGISVAVIGKSIKIGVVLGVGALAGCQGSLEDMVPKAQRQVPAKLLLKMKAKSMRQGAPILVRIFKEENTLEVWKKKTNGRFGLLKSYEICKWSGKFGPKFKEGDRQAPEGFYTVNPYQMNPKSSYYLSFNMGFPNKYDRAHGRTGSNLMVHGACSSAGCYSMTDDRVAEIYALARDAFKGGQKAFQIQAYPFHLTPENMFRHRDSSNFEFWKMLKVGYDQFEITKRPPLVEVCGGKYRFNVKAETGRKFSSRASCPPMYMRQSTALAYTKIKQRDDAAFDKLLAGVEGRKARDMSDLSVAAALPGIKLVAAIPAISSTKNTAAASGSEKLPGVTTTSSAKP